MNINKQTTILIYSHLLMVSKMKYEEIEVYSFRLVFYNKQKGRFLKIKRGERRACLLDLFSLPRKIMCCEKSPRVRNCVLHTKCSPLRGHRLCDVGSVFSLNLGFPTDVTEKTASAQMLNLGHFWLLPKNKLE